MAAKSLLAATFAVIALLAGSAQAQTLPTPAPLTGAEWFSCWQAHKAKSCTVANVGAYLTGTANTFGPLQTFYADIALPGLAPGGVMLAQGTSGLHAVPLNAGQALVGQSSGDPAATTLGSFAFQSYASPPPIGMTAPNAGTFSPLIVPPVGSAPASPANGQIWTTSSGVFAQLAGTTYQLGGSPFGVSSFNGRYGAVALTSGDVTTALGGSQTGNTFFAAPNGSAGAPSFRSLVAADIPALSVGTGGANAITYTAPYVGSVAEALSSRLGQYLSVKDFGVTGNGTTDDTAAMTTALQAAATACRDIYVPAGTYKLTNTSQMAITVPASCHLSIVGAGQDATVLNFPNGGGLLLTLANVYSSANVSDMTFETGQLNSTGTGLELHGLTTANSASTAMNILQNLVFRGSDGYAVNFFWNNGIVIYQESNVNIISSQFVGSGGTLKGTGVYIVGTSATYSVAENFVGDDFLYGNIGITYGAYTQGVTVTGSNFTGGLIGIFANTGETFLDELEVSNSQFNCYATAIDLLSGIASVGLNNNLFILVSNTTGVAGNLISFTIVGNQFEGSGTKTDNSIVATSGALSGVIMGNIFSGANTAVWLQAGSSYINVQGNSYYQNNTNTLNSGTNNTIGVATP